MKKRIISAIFLMIIFIPLLLLGGLPYALLMGLLGVFGLYELLKVRKKTKKLPLYVELFAYIITVLLIFNNYDIVTLNYMIDYRLLSVLIFATIAPVVLVNDNKKYNFNDALFLLGATLFIGLTFNLLVLLRNYKLEYVIYIFIITVITDTFALLTGRKIGKNKLAPDISPNKTIEGLVGGTIMATFIAVLYYNNVIDSSLNIVVVIFMSLFLSLIGQLGDLVFSFIKREYGAKDFSNLIPGHGGILDRLDSVIFVVLGFILFLAIL